MHLTYADRAKFALNPLGKKLLNLMSEKKTNLAVSADVTSAAKLLEIAEKAGPYMAVLKTHIDILTDFTPEVIEKLTAIAAKHQFLIFEDRKFADIGNTVLLQYKEGVYRISSWADIVNAHVIPGPSIIESLKKEGLPKGRGLLLIAEMSSKDNLATGHYTKKTVEYALEHPEFVIGFICQNRLCDDPAMIYMTPGVNLAQSGDTSGQQYTTPHEVIFERECDMIIVGRGIITAADIAAVSEEYRLAGWHAYENRITT
jgi:orotidine 5'-phosphate decarboxylase subfamily 1